VANGEWSVANGASAPLSAARYSPFATDHSPFAGAAAQPRETRPVMAMARPLAEIKDMSFERALKELESIVERLEKGAVELEESIVIYERGEALREHCDRLLKQAEAKVERLTLGPNGAPTGTEPCRPQE